MGFSQTYRKLSQFLKERRSHGDFGFPNTSKLEFNGGKELCGASTMNLFPMNNMEEKERNLPKGGESFKSWDLFPLMSSPTVVNTAKNRSELPTNNGEATTASMTIFYGGKVLVFDDLPEDKALEIMSFATQGLSNSQTQTQTRTRTRTRTQIPNNHTPIEAQSTPGAVVLREQPNLSDLPIARRVSLHRFMKKRKDRIAGNAPYPLYNSPRGNYMKDEIIEDIDDQQSEKKLELNLFN